MKPNLMDPRCSPASDVQSFPSLRRDSLEILQVNLTYRCNQSCSHCHVNASPSRSEVMTADIVELIPAVLRARGFTTLDFTGGAPELHPQFRQLVRQSAANYQWIPANTPARVWQRSCGLR